MNDTGSKIVDALIKWAVPAAGAALVGAWQAAGPQYRWIVLTAAALTVAICYTSVKNSKTAAAINQRIDKLEHDQQERDKQETITRRAFRAMLDDDMGKLYCHALQRGYTTEDERRRYARLQAAYKENGGNGEAERRLHLFDAIPDEETYRLAHGEEIVECM